MLSSTATALDAVSTQAANALAGISAVVSVAAPAASETRFQKPDLSVITIKCSHTKCSSGGELEAQREIPALRFIHTALEATGGSKSHAEVLRLLEQN
jgi:hypothetical protein